MPAIEVLQRAIRDLVALSAAPLLWKDLDEDSVAESLASTLVTMLDADFVYISIPTLAVAVEMACGPEGRVPVPLIPTLRASLHASLANSSGKIVSPLSGDPVNVLSTPLEFMPGAILIVASKRSDYPTEIDTVIQRIAAAQVTTVLQQRQNLTAAGYLAKLINLSSDFFGVVDLGGVPLFVNPAGLEHVGMASIQEALEHRFADFLEIDDRDRARYEIWPTILSDGRWSGQLSFLNAKTGAATPFYFECFRIDVPPTGPVAVGTISRSVNARNRVEGIPDDTSGFAMKRDAAHAVARIGTLSERERQVLLALAAGHPHKLIAHDLGISVRTIEVHRSRMMRRLGVRSLAEAITLAVLAGTVE